MPTVNGKKYPYTKRGMKQAAAARSAKGRSKKYQMGGPVAPGKRPPGMPGMPGMPGGMPGMKPPGIPGAPG